MHDTFNNRTVNHSAYNEKRERERGERVKEKVLL